MGKKVICLDVNCVLDGWAIDKTMYIAENYGYLFYDSYNCKKLGLVCTPPYMVDPDEVMDKILVDVSTEEGKKLLEVYNFKYKDELNG